MLNRHNKIFILAVAVLALLSLSALYLRRYTFAILQPAGPIAAQEKQLLIAAVLLMLIVVIPVFVLLGTIAWKYRASNTTAKYTPDWDRHAGYETIWWTVPLLLIVSLSVLTWHSTHTLDPMRPISSVNKPITIQAVALQWKWLFIYPDQQIASVNYVQFPKDTPINFQITSDAAMNSFWIPQLGGQIYAMAGMSTQLHLMASKYGSFRGASANISGKGFAGMNFMAKATSRDDYEAWVRSAQLASQRLDMAKYSALAQPSEYNRPAVYALQAQGLYGTIIGKSAGPGSGMNGMTDMDMSSISVPGYKQ